MKLIVTGACGFIGSHFAEMFKEEHEIIVLDSVTYAGKRSNLPTDIVLAPHDICNYSEVKGLIERFAPDAIVNFSAETHVDRAIKNDSLFMHSNVEGVLNLLHISKEVGLKRFLQVSTDEVYGQIKKGEFTEEDPVKPRNPYSATKAAAEHLVKSYHITHGLDAVITRGSNTYGPRQFPEKLIPTAIKKIKNKKKIPVYGKGLQARDWLFVEDHARGINHVLLHGDAGEVYNISGGHEMTNIDLVKYLIKSMGESKDLIEFVKDRPGHDFRYAMSSDKIKSIGWSPKMDFETGIEKTIDFYS